ncbi:Uncharacterised protein [Klebsiella pneumoniae]|uniref:Uncharacterized protein n=1 Tax=Klebsiella pneumoniae TaxID=573 RepID=A0A2X3EJU2_KLEPN|nr:Uncharacterised protein [Klebsiella pneumoniae]SSM27235.1 Uncharacterised protein [Klebsiella pneumoniae]
MNSRHVIGCNTTAKARDRSRTTISDQFFILISIASEKRDLLIGAARRHILSHKVPEFIVKARQIHLTAFFSL